MTAPKAGTKWTRIETLAAFALYCKLPFGKLHKRNPDIIALAGRLGRTPDSIVFRCVNIASLDPTHQKRGVKGMKNVSEMDRIVWGEFQIDPERISAEAIHAFGDPTGLIDVILDEPPLPILKGKESQRLAKVRLNQRFFRKLILASFNESCAVCSVPLPQLLVASHIIPWAVDETLRMNPRNGLCLCGTHDRAFEWGLLRIAGDYRMEIVVPKKVHNSSAVNEWLLRYDGSTIKMPQRWIPEPALLIRKLQSFKTPPP